MALGQRQTAVERVPFELWDAIFKFACAKDDTVDSSVTNFHRPHPPYPYLLPIATFSQVCSKWRDVASTIPQPWTEIHLELFNENQGPDHWPNHNLLRSFLDNSAGKPLTVNLTLHSLTHENKGHLHAFVFLRDLFFLNRRRWKTASMYLAFGGIDTVFWSIFEWKISKECGFPILESLDITLGPQPLLDEDLGTIEIPSFLWQNAPALKRLAITMERVDLPEGVYTPDYIVVAPRWVLETKIPYAQLTHLLIDARDEGDLTWIEIHTIFSLAPNLVCAFLLGIKTVLREHRRMRGRPPPHPILLKELRHLYFQTLGDSCDAFIGCDLDEVLIAPSLKTLAFVDLFLDWDSHNYQNFITHSQCDLESLYLAMPQNSIRLPECLEAIQLSPHLETIHLDWWPSHDSESELIGFATSMAEWNEDAITPGFRICPQLEQLSIWHKDLISGSSHGKRIDEHVEVMDNVADMLKKRCLPPNGSTGRMKTLALPSDVLENKAVMDILNPLHESPWNLEIVENITVLDMRSMWRRYGGCD